MRFVFRYLILLAAGLALPCFASFHLWGMNELYSNADGSVQFLRLTALAGNQQFVASHTISVSQGTSVRTFTLPGNLPGDTAGHDFLIGTQGFASLAVVTPDYIVPNSFFFADRGHINWGEGADVWDYTGLPADGTLSLARNGTLRTNSPRNFAGQTGTVTPTAPATVPAAPTIGTATSGNGQASIAFTAPVSNGGSPITSYTATCGVFSAAGPVSPITVTGLTNGTTYSCSITATNVIGTSPPSGTASVTPIFNSFTAASATGTGTITASFTGGGAGCSFVTHQFIGAPPGALPIPPTAPGPGIAFPHGLFDFSTSGCTPNSTVTLTITYPNPINGATYWKYGPTAAIPAAHWYMLPAILVGNTATFTITDGGLGDDDLAANGAIVDQGGPGFGASPSVPTLSGWMLLFLALTIFALTIRHQMRRHDMKALL